MLLNPITLKRAPKKRQILTEASARQQAVGRGNLRGENFIVAATMRQQGRGAETDEGLAMAEKTESATLRQV